MTDDVTQSESYLNSIVKQENEALGERSRSERLADTVASFAGSFAFIALHLAFVTCWVFANSGNTAMADPFDPYPFSLLGVIVALEAVILSSFVLMRQNHGQGFTTGISNRDGLLKNLAALIPQAAKRRQNNARGASHGPKGRTI